MPSGINLTIDKEWLLDKYIKERLSIASIALLLKVHPQTITNHLKKHNITRRLNSTYRYSFNEYFFECPNTINSYWAGFIAADGCILNTKYKQQLSIQLSQKDLSHLIRFKNDINYSGKIHLDKYRENKISHRIVGGFGKCRIFISSDIICKHLLENYNITTNKTYTLKPPKIQDDINILSFIAGLIDGDGSIGLYKDHIQIRCCGTLDILVWMKHNIERICDIKKKISIYKRPGCFILNINSNDDNISLYKKISNLGLPLLDRKWSTCKDFLKNKPTYRKNALLIEYCNKKQTLLDWSKELNIKYHTLYNRIYERGWCIEKAFTQNIFQ